MSSLYYFNPLAVTNNLLRKEVISWSKIYKFVGFAIGMNDRTGLFQQPIKLDLYDRCQLPKIKTTDLTYDECLDRRAKELFDLSTTLNKPLGIMWSGGIDSTAILVAFLRNFPLEELKDRIKIITSTEATLENPEFYIKYVVPNFEFINSEHTPWLFDGSVILVTGEFNDQLFGSDIIKVFLTSTGSAEVNSPLNRDQIFNYINTGIEDERVSNILIDAVLNSSESYGVPLEKNNDFFWWWNFCFKWQNVHFRIYSLTFPRLFDNVTEDWDKNHMHHFYQTDKFQQWSMSNPEIRYIDDWKHYKMKAKESIFKFDKNAFYLNNKVKRPSLQTVFYQRLVADGITSDFKILEKFNAHEYFNSNSAFK